MEEIILKNIDLLIKKYFSISKNDKVLILFDKTKYELALIFRFAIIQTNDNVIISEIDSGSVHGETKISNAAYSMMLDSDIIISLVQYSIAHTKERYNITKLGKRFVSMPDYSINLLARDCFDLDFNKIVKKQNKLASILQNSNSVKIKTKMGTDITFDISNRVSNNCPGFINKSFLLASPPDFEVNIAIKEDDTNGILVVDGSIPYNGFGVLSKPIKLEIRNGRVIKCNDKKLMELFNKYGEKAKIPAELGFGFNYKAKLSGFMLEDEGCYNTFHIGFGSNSTIGGENIIKFHLDTIVLNPSVEISGKLIINEGKHVY
ncbi:MAG: aminopeptidase [Arcobacter sp.]|uniref:aminopeptidase n=1 Tax=Arcobacter sp. TaxID=1872629 RepID=UPI003B001801